MHSDITGENGNGTSIDSDELGDIMLSPGRRSQT